MRKEPRIFLQHILESIEAIEESRENLSEETFLNSREKQDAIIRRLEIIGEAVKNLPADFKKDHPELEWEKAMGIRNILIHHYFGIDLRIVWDTVIKSLPEFKKQIKGLIKEES